jgi:hypothetical protein
MRVIGTVIEPVTVGTFDNVHATMKYPPYRIKIMIAAYI